MSRVVFLAGLLLLLASCSGASRDGSGAISQAGELSAFDLSIGDCFDDPTEDGVSEVAAVPCSQAHDNEVFAVVKHPDGEYPGAAAMQEYASTECSERFEPYVGEVYESSALLIYTMPPTQQTWEKVDDRQIVCVLSGEEKLTGSVQGSGAG